MGRPNSIGKFPWGRPNSIGKFPLMVIYFYGMLNHTHFNILLINILINPIVPHVNRHYDIT